MWRLFDVWGPAYVLFTFRGGIAYVASWHMEGIRNGFVFCFLFLACFVLTARLIGRSVGFVFCRLMTHAWILFILDLDLIGYDFYIKYIHTHSHTHIYIPLLRCLRSRNDTFYL